MDSRFELMSSSGISSMSVSLGLGLRCICSNDTALNKRCDELAEHLKKRGYKENLILLEINKAEQVPRDQALKPSVPKKQMQPRHPVRCHLQFSFSKP